MKSVYLICVMLLSTTLLACGNKQQAAPAFPQNRDSIKVKITIGQSVYSATLQDNETARAFTAKLPMTVDMVELNGNEKYVDLPAGLPAKASNPATIQNGDLMLYGSRTLVLFYQSFATSYSYTRIGRIDDPSGLAAALGKGNVTVTFGLE